MRPMSDSTTITSQKEKRTGAGWTTLRILRGIVGLVALAAALGIGALALAPHQPDLPYIGVATLVTPQYVGPLIILAGVVLGVAVLLVLLRARILGGLAFLIALASIVSLGYLMDEQIEVARDEYTEIDIKAAMDPSGLADGAQPDRTVDYATGPEGPLKMDIYHPSEQKGKSAPVLLYVHGGGWDQMDRGSQARNMRWFADQGFLVLSADYTLATDQRATWDLAARDVSCALAWVRSEAASQGGDVNRFFTYGESAGGALVMTASYDAAENKTAGECGAPAVPKAVYADSPAIDPRTIADSRDQFAGEGSRETIEKYLGGAPAKVPERADAVTVANHVTRQSQPTFVVRSDKDRLVPPSSYREYRERMHSSERELTEIVRPHADHASALTYHGVWNQMLRHTLFDFFEAQGAFGEPPNPFLKNR